MKRMFVLIQVLNDVDRGSNTLSLIIVLLIFVFIFLQRNKKIDIDKLKIKSPFLRQEPSEELKMKNNEQRIKDLFEKGVLSEEEYRRKISEAQIKSGDYNKIIDNLKALLDAGLITEDEFNHKSKEVYEKRKNDIDSEKTRKDEERKDIIAKMKELLESGVISQEEYDKYVQEHNNN